MRPELLALLQAAADTAGAYRAFPGIGSRAAVWIAAQVHLMFAAFVLGVPMFAVITEAIGIFTRDTAYRERYDKLSKEFTRLLLVAYSATAIWGAVLTFFLTTLYPRFWNHMADIFHMSMWVYAGLFFVESFTLYLYYYGWDRWKYGRAKYFHWSLGILLNVFGTAVMLIANGWLTYMMSPPAGMTAETLPSEVGLWNALANMTWMPINIHRLIANAVFGGSIVGAYAAYRFLAAKTKEERAHYDWMGYIGNFIAISTFIVLPFAGYWLGREIYEYNQKTELGLATGEADRTDGAFMFRGASFDEFFPGERLVETAVRQAGEMGLDARGEGRIHHDDADRERKRARAFCAPVRVPDEVYLVIRPHGGYVDYRAFWHEMGHALHFANAARQLPFEDRWLGDNSVTECYAMLFEHQLMAPGWLARYAGLGGSRRDAFLRAQAFDLLAIVRRYAAKLEYEVELHRAPSLQAGASRYVERLTDATGFRYAAEDALLDLDDAFYAARYLRAWQLESALRSALIDRFDDDWFRNPKCGPFVLELLSRGQRDDAVEVARSVLGAQLGFEALVTQCEAALS